MPWTYFTTEDRAIIRAIAHDLALVRASTNSIAADLSAVKPEIAKMTVNVDALVAAVAAEESAEQATVAVLNEIITELTELRSQGGGALQNQIDSLTGRLQATTAALLAAASAGTAVEQPASGATGAAQAAADHLAAQASNPPA